MIENNFEVRIGSCEIPCNKQNAMYVSEVISNYVENNPDAQYMDINLSYFSESQDKEFVYKILNKNDRVTIFPGREIFFRYFCTEMKINTDIMESVQIASIVGHNKSLNILILCEEKLFSLNRSNFDATYQFFTDGSKNIIKKSDKYSIALLFLNSCFARPFKIELYIKLLFEVSKYDQSQKEKSNEDDKTFFEIFMKCFSLELNMAFSYSADYQYLDEIVFILRCLFDDSRYFNTLILKEDEDVNKTDFLNLYFKDKYNMISFNSLKPLFIDFVRITDLDVDDVMKKYSEQYDQIKDDNFFLHKNYAHEGFNGDKLARLIIFDESEKLENILLQSYHYMKENTSKITEEKETTSSTNSSLLNISSNNNFSLEFKPIEDELFEGKDSFSLLAYSGESIVSGDVIFEEKDIKEIALKLATSPYYTVNKSIYERCSFLNKGCTLLEYAAFCGSIKCFKMLLKHNRQDQDIEIIDDDNDFRMNLNINSDLARFAVSGGSIEIIKLILEMINKNDSESDENPVSFANTLQFAAQFHRWELAEWLIEKMKNEFIMRSEFLNQCIQYSNMKMLSYFIQNRIKMSHEFLLTCCQYGNFCLAEWALSFSVRDAVNLLDNDVHTSILHWACLLDHKQLLILILHHRKENRSIIYNTTGSNKKYNNDYDSNCYVNQNLDFGVDINAKSGHYYHDSTALHLAVEDNNVEFTKIILDEGILNNELPISEEYNDSNSEPHFGSLDIEIKNRNTMTPFHIACKNGNLEIVKLFLNHKDYDVDINAETTGIL